VKTERKKDMEAITAGARADGADKNEKGKGTERPPGGKGMLPIRELVREIMERDDRLLRALAKR